MKPEKMGQLLLINMAGQLYSLPLEQVDHIQEFSPQALEPIPLAPSPIIGLSGSQGRVVTVVDLASYLQIPNTASCSLHTLITLTGKFRDVAFLINNISQILTWMPTTTIETSEGPLTITAPDIDFSTVKPLVLDEVIKELCTLSAGARRTQWPQKC